MKRASLVLLIGLCLPFPSRGADEFSGADKLRSIYSAEFRFDKQGLPVVPVAIAEGLVSVSIRAKGGGLRVQPEGDGGADIVADDTWQIRASSTSAAKLRYWSVVWRGPTARANEAEGKTELWKSKGERVQRFEQGTLFGVSGKVLDRREIVVGVGPHRTAEEAEKALEGLAAKAALLHPGVFTELVDRPHGQLEAVGDKTGIRVRNEGVLWFSPAGDGALQVEGILEPGRERARVSGSYAGRLYVTIDRRGRMAVVNAIPENRFLAGLLPSEMFPSAPEEALKAQAVAARGELLSKIGTRHIGDPFRLCSTTHCQVYSGLTHETARTTAAVEATRGEVLFEGAGDDLADPVYSANCGGHTENNENVWPDMPPLPSLRGHRDASVSGQDAGKVGHDVFANGITPQNLLSFIASAPPSFCGRAKLGAGERFRWTVTRTRAELDKLLAKYRLGRIRAIEVLERGVSGRARAVRLRGEHRDEVIRGELRIRQTFGNLRSSLFVVEMKDGNATFRGAGFGHGVGMCQTGAMGMAEAGHDYREILRHYYPGTVLRKLW